LTGLKRFNRIFDNLVVTF